MKRGRKKKLAISLMDYMGKRRDMKRQLKKEGTAELYEVAVRHFLRFVKNPGFCLADLNRALEIDFITYLQGKGLATNTVNTYISSLRALYNMACQEALIPASYYPFENLKLRRAMTARRAIPASLFQQIAQIKVADDPQVELSIDLSLFSFMACGMPFVDIAYLTRQNIRGNELVYHRHKTGRMIRLEITSSMLQLIRKYADRQRATGSPYLFPILPPGNPDHLRYKRSLARHNARLKRIGQTLRLPNPFTSYVVRHSWASEALRCDMPMALISQALGHSSEKTTRFYLEELDISRLAHANMKVIGSVNRILEKRMDGL